MEAMKQVENNEMIHSANKSKKQKSASIYSVVWRWHFYAGIIFAPFLLILAFSGGVYLFKPQIESFLYQDLYEVEEVGSATLSSSEQLVKVKEAYPDSVVTSMVFSDDEESTTKMGLMMANGDMTSVYLNPYTGEVAGTLKPEEQFTEIFKKIHSELLVGGTVANRLVELAACWAIILLLTGLYIWWPRSKASIWGTVLPRFGKKGRLFWRDMHAVPAFWLSIFIVLLIATGLPWSGVMGEQINRLATSTNTGYPPFALSFGEKPESDIRTKDVAEDVPWAAENVPVPNSSETKNSSLSIEKVSEIAKKEEVEKPYTISFPQGEKGVYTISTSHSKPGNNATLHVDQYNGSVLTDVRFSEYGIMAKGITLGIALHEGRLFGIWNQIIGLLVCIGIIGIIISSFVMWRKRKPTGKLGAPSKPKNKNITRTVFFMMLVLGVIMPLVGISIIVVFLIDRFIVKRIKKLDNWIGA